MTVRGRWALGLGPSVGLRPESVPGARVPASGCLVQGPGRRTGTKDLDEGPGAKNGPRTKDQERTRAEGRRPRDCAKPPLDAGGFARGRLGERQRRERDQREDG